MKNFLKLLPLILIAVFIACSNSADATPPNGDGGDPTGTLHAAFAEFDADETNIYLDGNQVVIETTGNPNHASVYWGDGHPLYQEEPGVQTTPSIIPNFDGSATLRVSTDPQLANTSTATNLGAIGIAVSGAAIYNDQEGNGPLNEAAVSLDLSLIHI